MRRYPQKTQTSEASEGAFAGLLMWYEGVMLWLVFALRVPTSEY